MKIGVFDSGIGGEKVAYDLQVHFPDAKIITVSDREHLPYGSKSEAEITALTHAAIQPLLSEQCDTIVIACNTATSVALTSLRLTYPEQKFIGIEPMIKPAATMTKTGVICVCATPATLASERYSNLKNTFATDITVIEPNCSTWASLIETSSLDEELVRQQIIDCLDRDSDIIILGCTHYHWIKELIESIAKDRAIVLEPTSAIAARISSLIE